jgi:hypothetical protein
MSEDISAGEGEGEGKPSRRGRHAAKRKALLQRLHMPVGKAVALAAMPSAVLLGTGFTSPLAKADQQPDNPFRGDSCVEMPDPAQPEEEQREEPQQQQEQQQQERPEQEATAEPQAEETAEPDQDQTPAAEETAPPEAQDTEQEPEPEPEPEPEASAEETQEPSADGTGETDGTGDSGGLLGGIGEGLEDIGEGLGDLLTPGDGGETTEPEQPEEETPEEETPAPEEPEESPEETEEPAQPAEPSPEETPDDEDGRNEQDDSAQGEGSDPAREEEPGQEPSASPQQPPAGEDGTQPFPCPEEKRVAGVDEETALVLPNNPWYLEATSLTLYGLDYHGVVNVTTANGTTKQVLKFTADEIDIGDLHQIVDGPGGVRRHVATQPGSTSTFRNGTVTLYTERLQGNLFGLIPITFDPEHQPPLDLPIANFTDVFVIQAGQFGGELTMTGMDSYISHDGPTPTER